VPVTHLSEAGLEFIRLFEGAYLSSEVVSSLEKEVSKLVTAPVNQNQFDALISFASNMGVEVLSNSKLLERINALEDPSKVAEEELHKWNKEGSKVFHGLSRRRSAELELFCHKPPEFKWGWVFITSKCHTSLKKRPAPDNELSSDEIAKISPKRLIRRCRVIERTKGYTYLEFGFGLGEWWVLDRHWDGLRTEVRIEPYARKDNLVYLRDFPYLHRPEEESAGWGISQCCAIAMCLKYLDAPTINCINDYMKVVNKYGRLNFRGSHIKAMKEFGFCATFNHVTATEDIKDNLKQGLPVVGVIAGRSIRQVGGMAHSVVITGYDDENWLVQDPFGELDLIVGRYKDRGADAGKNVLYNAELFNKRLSVGGGIDGWCWLNFRECTVKD